MLSTSDVQALVWVSADLSDAAALGSIRNEEAPDIEPSLAWPCRLLITSPEALMNGNKWIRQIHRWLAMTFTVTVVVTFVALAQEEPVVWVSYVPLLPLAFLLLTGLYLFALPYVSRWRRRQARNTA
jgi:hypothetical protein